MAGRLPGTPKPPGSGRKRGSITREDRKVLTDRMAGDLMYVYAKLGGRQFLLKFAQENPAEFMRQGLSRLFPAFPKPEGDPDVLVQTQNNFNGDPTEVARRIAFALAAGIDQQQVVEERQPYVHLAQEPTPQELLRDPAPDPLRQQWAEQVAMTPEERLNAEDIDAHTSRKAFATPRPAWMDEPKPAGRPFVGHPRRKDLL